MTTTNQSQAYYEKQIKDSSLFLELHCHNCYDELLTLIAQQISEDNDLVIG